MNKTLATAVFIIIEAGIEELIERIKQRRRRNARSGGLDHLCRGRGAHGLRDQPAAESIPVRGQRRSRRTHGRCKLQERTEYQERSA